MSNLFVKPTLLECKPLTLTDIKISYSWITNSEEVVIKL